MKATFIKISAFCLIFAGIVTQNASAQCAITTTPTNDCSYGDAIDNFTIGVTSVANAGCSSGTGYSAYATPVFNLVLGTPYGLTAAVGGGTYNQGLSIWIDLDNNGQYDPTEQVFVSTAAALSHTGTITIASGVTGVPLPMRVMCAYNLNPPAGSACTSNQGGYGETEDYIVMLSGGSLPSNVEATAIFEPVDNDCGDVADEVWVTVSNLTANQETNIPVEVTLSGMATGTYNDTIDTLAGNSSVNLLMATLDTQAGGQLDIQLVVNLGDDDPTDDTLSITVNIQNSTALDLSGMTSACEGDSVQITLNNALAGETYTWYVDGAMAGSGFTDLILAVSATSQVVVTSSNACRQNDTLDITVYPIPTASFTSSVNVDVVTFTATASNYDTLTWDFGDGAAGSGLSPQHTYAANGDYIVCISAGNMCGTTFFCDTVSITEIGVGIEEFAGGEVSIYPNPTHDDVKIVLQGMEGFTGNWKLFNLEGKELQKGELKINTSNTELLISLGNYATGTYLLKISDENGRVFEKELIRN